MYVQLKAPYFSLESTVLIREQCGTYTVHVRTYARVDKSMESVLCTCTCILRCPSYIFSPSYLVQQLIVAIKLFQRELATQRRAGHLGDY